MGWRKIGEVSRDAGLADLVAQANRNAALVAAIKENLPDWLEPSSLSYSLGPDGILEVTTTAGAARQLQQILPALRESLLPFGVRKLVIKRS